MLRDTIRIFYIYLLIKYPDIVRNALNMTIYGFHRKLQIGLEARIRCVNKKISVSEDLLEGFAW